jgi:hypothetical protein
MSTSNNNNDKSNNDKSNNNNNNNNNQDDLPSPRISLNESFCTNSRLFITVTVPFTTTTTTATSTVAAVAITAEAVVDHLELWVRGRETWRQLEVHRSTTSSSILTWTVNHEGALEAAGQELHIKCRASYKSHDNQNTTTMTNNTLYSQWTEGTLLVTICPQKRQNANVTPDPIWDSEDDNENLAILEAYTAAAMQERTIPMGENHDIDTNVHHIGIVAQDDESYQDTKPPAAIVAAAAANVPK